MARLPVPGQDSGQWGQILNEYLKVHLNDDGTLKPASVVDSIPSASIDVSQLSTAVQQSLANADAAVSGTAPDAAAGVKGLIALGGNGDLTGDATNPVIKAGGITTAKIANDAVTSVQLDSTTRTTLTSVASKYTKPGAGIPTADIADGAISNIKLDTATRATLTSVAGKYTKPGTGIPSTDLVQSVQDTLTKASNATSVVNATSTVPGIVTLTGALAGTATNPALSANSVSNATIANGAVTSTKLANAINTSLGLANTSVQSVNGQTGASINITATSIGAVQSSLLTTKGDMFVATSSGVVDRLPAGTAGRFLIADSSQDNGLDWVDLPDLGGSPIYVDPDPTAALAAINALLADGQALGKTGSDLAGINLPTGAGAPTPVATPTVSGTQTLNEIDTRIANSPLAGTVANNTSVLANKADASALTTGLNGKVSTSTYVSGLAGKADLIGGKIPTSQIPSLSVQSVFVAANQAAMLASNASVGDLCKRSDLGSSFFLTALPATTLSNWTTVIDPSATPSRWEVDMQFDGNLSTGDASVIRPVVYDCTIERAVVSLGSPTGGRAGIVRLFNQANTTISSITIPQGSKISSVTLPNFDLDAGQGFGAEFTQVGTTNPSSPSVVVPSVSSFGRANYTTPSSPIIVNRPANAQAGDIWIIIITSNVPTTTLSGPGFNIIREGINPVNNDVRSTFGWHLDDGSGAAVAITPSTGTVYAGYSSFVVRGADQANPIQIASTLTTNGTTSTSVSYPGLTPTAGYGLFLTLGVHSLFTGAQSYSNSLVSGGLNGLQSVAWQELPSGTTAVPAITETVANSVRSNSMSVIINAAVSSGGSGADAILTVGLTERV